MNISLIDETFNFHNSEHYKLTIQFIPDGFSFVILDTVRNKFVCLKHSDFKSKDELKDLLIQDELLKLNYQSSKAYVFSEKTTLIPEPFFSNQKLGQFIDLTMGDVDQGIINQSKAAFDTCLAYSMPNEIHGFIQDLNIQKTVPLSHSLLSAAFKNKLIKEKYTGVFLHLVKDFAQIVVVESGNLLFFNVFPYNTTEDLCYFVLYVFETFKLDKSAIDIIISGIVPKNDPKIKFLSGFFKKIDFALSEKQYIYSYRFNEVPQHFFSNLFLNINEDN